MARAPRSPPRSASRARTLPLAGGCLLLAAALAGCGGSGKAAAPPGVTCALPQAASLSVVQLDPPNGATGVFVGANVTVRFNTCLDPTTATAANFLLAAGPSFVPRAVSYDPATATVTIDPAGNLAYSTLHLVAVSGVRGAHGETMTGAGSSFQTQAAPESIPPTTAASPPGGRYNTPQSVALICTDNPGGTGCAGTWYTVNGSAPTTASTRYTVPIAIAADTTLRFFSRDAQGNAEAPRQEVYVIDTVPPALVASDPADGATGVPVNKVLTATFSEEMKAATLGPATVTADNGVALTVSY
ncbi:MAG TPA: Ig-like domain-containing protein, partial [Frankiaceae bacterium]|nr:Ig-like domain-containing protein [Frankiaceae bacterium]